MNTCTIAKKLQERCGDAGFGRGNAIHVCTPARIFAQTVGMRDRLFSIGFLKRNILALRVVFPLGGADYGVAAYINYREGHMSIMKVGIALAALLLLACDKNKDKSTDVPLDSDSSAQEMLLSSSSVGGSSSAVEELSSSSVDSVFVGKGLMLDDLEKPGQPLAGGVWYSWVDKVDGGNSDITNLDSAGQPLVAAGGYYSGHALSLAFQFDKGKLSYAPYIGFGLTLNRTENPALASMAAFGGISYYYKGATHSVRVDASDVLDYDVHVVVVPASREWKKVSFSFAEFKQEGWGKFVLLSKEHIQNISWQVKGVTGMSDSLLIDNLYLGDTSEIKTVRVEDLGTPKAAEIPVVTPLASIAITNPMQALAQKLSNGLNITNWLEEASSSFSTFLYQESDVKNWSAKGFKALRLPVDLDQYVVDKAGYLAGTAQFAVTENLWIVLDSFDLWTARHGMSLTIDYHEYDKGFDATSAKNAVYVSMMTRLWKSVAEHFATNTRDDLFYELFNEPDNAIGAATWGAVAQSMIDSIRTVDTQHAVIFGDINWYGITSLVNRTPLSDTKVIYAIHYYEPFVFSHQGTSWTDAKTLHGIPFPYDASKWPTSSADLGVTSSTVGYIKTQLANYYKTGNKEAQMIQIQKAKQWAVSHNVPLILNEFGAFDPVADAQSRLTFYRAITDICKELDIPWQHWGIKTPFEILTPSGELLPGMKDALRL